MSTVVHVSGCASPLLYFLLYEVDMQAAGQLSQTRAGVCVVVTQLVTYRLRAQRDVARHSSIESYIVKGSLLRGKIAHAL